MKILDYKTLGFSNDFMFGHIMQDPKICKPFLERVLGIKIRRIEYLEMQKGIDLNTDSKSIRLDVYVEDDANTVYNCEMQTTSNRNLPKRSRYYQGIIDLNLIHKGEDYGKLKKSFVIFICTFDPFGKNLYKYTFRNICKEFPELELEDDTWKIFLSTKGMNEEEISPELADLLHYIENSDLEEGCQDPLLCDIHDALEAARNNEEWRREFMTLELLKNECREEGREEGRKEGRSEGENRLQNLFSLLLKAGRTAEMESILYGDELLKEKLYQEYGL